MEDIRTRLRAARPLETEARDGSHRRLCGGQDLLKLILAKHRTGQIRSQHLIADRASGVTGFGRDRRGFGRDRRLRA